MGVEYNQPAHLLDRYINPLHAKYTYTCMCMGVVKKKNKKQEYITKILYPKIVSYPLGRLVSYPLGHHGSWVIP